MAVHPEGRRRHRPEFDGFVRKLITYMMEDPRTISPSLDLLFLAKAIERIGDHAKNIAEFIDLRGQGRGRAPHADGDRSNPWSADRADHET
jgi:phosphate uptake regulator